MNKHEAEQLIKDFVTNESQQKFVADALDLMARLSAAVAEVKGFHDDELRVGALIRAGVGQTRIDLDVPQLAQQLKDWLSSQLLQAEIARMGEELGEAIDNIRHGSPPDDKCPEHTGWVVELVDVMIRAMDTLGKRNISPGQAFVDKTLMNVGRPYKHNKES